MNYDNYDDELLDLVNAHDEIIGTITHAQAFTITKTRLGYLRASNVFIMNREGKLWIPRRPAHKQIAPNALDYSMGEHVQKGESYLDAAVRGLHEELNLEVKPDELTFVAKIAPEPNEPPYFVCDYLYFSDSEPDYNRDDFASAEWLTAEAVKQQLASGDKGKTSLPHSIDALLAYQSNRQRHQ